MFVFYPHGNEFGSLGFSEFSDAEKKRIVSMKTLESEKLRYEYTFCTRTIRGSSEYLRVIALFSNNN